VEDLLAALFVKSAVETIGEEVAVKGFMVPRPSAVADHDRRMIGLARHRTERPELIGRERLLDGILFLRKREKSGFGLERELPFGCGFALKEHARGLLHGAVPVGEFGKARLDGGAENRREIALYRFREGRKVPDARLREASDVELERLRLHDVGRVCRNEELPRGVVRTALKVEPGDFVETPDVDPAEVVTADCVAAETAWDRREQRRIVLVFVGRLFTEKRTFWFGHAYGHG
jgi:hypothetical protein